MSSLEILWIICMGAWGVYLIIRGFMMCFRWRGMGYQAMWILSQVLLVVAGIMALWTLNFWITLGISFLSLIAEVTVDKNLGKVTQSLSIRYGMSIIAVVRLIKMKKCSTYDEFETAYSGWVKMLDDLDGLDEV